jgi:hypothetical protein
MILQGLLHSGQFQATSLELIINFMQVLFDFLTFNTQVGESFQNFDQVLAFWVAYSKNMLICFKFFI